jgi:thioredoxin 1
MKTYSILTLILVTGSIQAKVHSIITQEQFDSDIIQAGKPAIVKFYADWCGPCQTAQEPFHTLANQSEFRDITFGQVNADKAPQLIDLYTIKGLPTFLFFDKQGKEVLKKTGLLGASDAPEFTGILTQTLKQLFATDTPTRKVPEEIQDKPQSKNLWNTIQTAFSNAYKWIQNLFS